MKRVIFIINPAGTARAPILALLNEEMQRGDFEWDIFISKHAGDVALLAKRAVRQKPDVIAVYGGDGTILEAAKYIYRSKIPLVILPGGTANVLAKDLNIPLDLAKALTALRHLDRVTEVDVAECHDGCPLFLRVEVGLLADMVKHAKPAQKGSLGIFAYPMTVLNQLKNASLSTYTMKLDGRKKVVQGIGIMIANSGNVGLPGVSINKRVKVNDGIFDVFVLQSGDLATLLSVSTSTLTGSPSPTTLKHWRAKRISLQLDTPQTVVRDDQVVETDFISLKLSQCTLKVVKP